MFFEYLSIIQCIRILVDGCKVVYKFPESRILQLYTLSTSDGVASGIKGNVSKFFSVKKFTEKNTTDLPIVSQTSVSSPC